MPLQTPVVFIVFNRPELTKQSFALLRRAQPCTLFLVADGPRPGVSTDITRCQSVRDIVSEIDWHCQVTRIFATENLGCMCRITSGLNEVFTLVPEAIIVEDDCMPDATFFRFCEEMLERYRDDLRVGAVSGDNFQKRGRASERSYYFSRYPHCWGWATWRRAWQRLDLYMEGWPALRDKNWLEGLFPRSCDQLYWRKMFDETSMGRIDSWAFRWTLTCWVEGFLTVLPSVNLVTNVGFDGGGTNNLKRDSRAYVPSESMIFPLNHPLSVFAGVRADNYTPGTLFRRSLWLRCLEALKGMLR